MVSDPLAGNQVHLWQIPLDPGPAVAARFLTALTAGDLDAAERFRFPEDAERFRLARGALRLTLSACLDRSPHELQFERGPWGKPALIGANLEFNLSHSRTWMLLAVARGRRLGVDVEPVVQDRDLGALAKRVFNAAELAAWQTLPGEERVWGFYRVWTRKEAFTKAIGEGIRALGTFTVTVAGPAELIPGSPHGDDWHLLDVDDIPGHAACLVAEGSDWHIVRRSGPA